MNKIDSFVLGAFSSAMIGFAMLGIYAANIADIESFHKGICINASEVKIEHIHVSEYDDGSYPDLIVCTDLSENKSFVIYKRDFSKYQK